MSEPSSGRRPHLWLVGVRRRHGRLDPGSVQLPPALLRRRFPRWRLLSVGGFRMLRGLAESPETAEQRLSELARWQFERLGGTARASCGLSAGLIVGLVATQFASGLRVGAGWIALGTIGAVATCAFGLLAYARQRRHGELYVKALEILRRL